MSLAQFVLPIVAVALEKFGVIVGVLDVPPDPARAPYFGDMNANLIKVLGYTRDDLVGKEISFICDENFALDGIYAAMAARETYQGELNCRTRSGAQKFLQCYLMPAADATGEVHRYVLIGRDVSSERRQSAQSRQVQALLLKSFMLVDRALAIISADGRILMANTRLETIMGLSPGGLIGKVAVDLVAPPYRQMVLDAHDDHAGPEDSFQLQLEVLAQHGAAPALVRFARMGATELAGMTMLTVTPAKLDAQLSTRLLTGGKIRFIGLEAVRELLKDQWETTATQLLDMAETVIRQRLKQDDYVARTEDKGFVICFNKATETDASAISAQLARDIRQHLIGNGTNETMAGVLAITGQIAAARQGAPDLKQINRYLARLEDTITRQGWPDPTVDKIENAGSGTPCGFIVRVTPPVTQGVQQVFPVTHIGQEMMALKVTPTLPERYPLLVDTGFETFTNPAHIASYQDACMSLSETVRARLYPLLASLPKGMSQILIQDMVRKMSRFCAGFALRVDELKPPEFDLSLCRPAMIAIDVLTWDKGNQVPYEKLKYLIGLAHSNRIKILALNVGSNQISRNLMQSGVDWVTIYHEKS